MASAQERKDKTGKVISYQIKVSRGRDILTGKQLTPYTTTWTVPATWETWSRKTQEKELERVKAEFETACKRGEVFTKEEKREQAHKEQLEPTFAVYSEMFYNAGAATKSINTNAQYRRILDNCKPVFGQYKMKDIAPVMIKEYFTSLQNEGKREQDGKPLTHGTIKAYYKCLHALFEQAVNDDTALPVTKPAMSSILPQSCSAFLLMKPRRS